MNPINDFLKFGMKLKMMTARIAGKVQKIMQLCGKTDEPSDGRINKQLVKQVLYDEINMTKYVNIYF